MVALPPTQDLAAFRASTSRVGHDLGTISTKLERFEHEPTNAMLQQQFQAMQRQMQQNQQETKQQFQAMQQQMQLGFSTVNHRIDAM
jgi:hypothetical protein